VRGLPSKLVAGLVAACIVVLGAVGAYSYGREYYLHRGFAALVQLPRAGTGRLLEETFHSRALHRRADYMVYLPPGYTATRRYPVYYLLHGMPGQPHVFVTIANMDVRLDNQLSLGTVKPMILVYPDGRMGGSTYSDSEWANTPSGRFESYVIEVMHDVDHRFATLPLRQDRVIAGFSAGAYGAINIALHHLSDFANVQVWSGYFTQTRTGVFAHATRADLAYNSPLHYVRGHPRRLARDGMRAYMFVGRNDESRRQLLPMVDAMRSQGATVRYAIVKGGHDWSVWYPQLNGMLIRASAVMGLRPPRLSAARLGRLRRADARLARMRVGVRSRVARVGGPRVARVGGPRVGGSRVAREGGSRVARPRVGGSRVGRPPLRPITPPFDPRPILPAHHHARVHHRPPALDQLQLVAALLLALLSAALINLGFVLQHRGVGQSEETGWRGLGAMFGNRAWLTGQALGWFGFGGQILAVALAPLTLVQAFAAGSLAVSVPLAAWAFGHRIGRDQLIAVTVVAVSLFSLPIGFDAGHDHVISGYLIAAGLIILVAGTGLYRIGRSVTLAIAAGAFYGLADAAIKADAYMLRVQGIAGLVGGWSVLVAVGTFAGFLSFQAALRRAEAVNAISLMNAFTALTALTLGVVAFGESLGTSPAAAGLHVVAIGLVLAAVWPLARGQQQLAGGDAAIEAPAVLAPRTPVAASRGAAAVARGTAAVTAGALVVLVASFVGMGLLYGLRTLRWFSFGPLVRDALPLLQLAGFDFQPLARIAVAWLLVGLVTGLVLIRLRPSTRFLLGAIVGAFVLLVASDAASGLARNMPFVGVLESRLPDLGPWVEALLFAAGCAIPGRPAAELAALVRRVAAPRVSGPSPRSACSPASPPTGHPSPSRSRRTPRQPPASPSRAGSGSG
jgi:enterochelin esterase-like enzyme